jgi:hypothetical protein
MAISPLQLNGFGNINNTVDQAQWSTLGNLRNVYDKAQAQARQQQALASLGTDPQANMQTLITSQDPALAQTGLNLQQKSVEQARVDAANAQAQSNWQAQQTIREAQEARAAQADEEATPAGRTAKLVAAGLDPKDPAYAAHIATGAALPNLIQQHVDQRAQIEFDQAQKYATREARLQAVKDGELDINDPEIRRWVALGGAIPDPAKNRLGLGQPLYTRDDATGKLHAYQLSATGVPVETKFQQGQTVLGPGEVAQQKASGTAVGKAEGQAIVNLPKMETDAKLVTDTIDKALAPHPGKSWSVGTMFKDVPVLPGSQTANYRAILDQLDSQTFLEAYNSLRGGGAISNYEDKRASQAKARLSRAQSTEEFDNALREYKEIVQSGLDHARTLAGKVAPAATAAPRTGGKPDLNSLIPLN